MSCFHRPKCRVRISLCDKAGWGGGPACPVLAFLHELYLSWCVVLVGSLALYVTVLITKAHIQVVSNFWKWWETFLPKGPVS